MKILLLLLSLYPSFSYDDYTVALEILNRNVDGAINFRGFLVGNPYVDPFSNDVTMIQTYYMHGLFAKPLYDHWYSLCSDKSVYDAEVSIHFVDLAF